MTTSFCPFKNANSPQAWDACFKPCSGSLLPSGMRLSQPLHLLTFLGPPISPHSPWASQAPARITLSGFLHHAHFLHSRLSGVPFAWNSFPPCSVVYSFIQHLSLCTYAGTGSLNLLIQTQKLYWLGSTLSGFYSASAKTSLLPEAFPKEGLNFHRKLTSHTHTCTCPQHPTLRLQIINSKCSFLPRL